MKKKYLIVGCLLVLFLLITILVQNNATKIFDDAIYNFLIGQRSNFLDNIFKTITILGNTLTIIILLLLSLAILRKDYKYLLLLNTGVCVFLNIIIKNIVKRPRPNHLRLIKESGYSYPSGHAMISIAFYGFLLYYVNKNIHNKYLKLTLNVLLLIIIIGIGCSRIYVGVHYPSDVIAGYILAIASEIIVLDVANNYVRGNINDKNGRK